VVRLSSFIVTWVLVAAAAGAAPVATPSSPPAQPQGPAQVHRSAAITLKVTDFDATMEKLLDLAKKLEAKPTDSKTQVNFMGAKHGWIRFHLEASELDEALAQVKALGVLYGSKTTVEDRTDEYQELEGRITDLRTHEQDLRHTLELPRRMRGSDILYLQERLLSTRFAITGATQTRQSIERRSRVGSLVVFLFEPGTRGALGLGDWYAGSVLRAKGSALRSLAKVGTGAIFAVYFAWVWVPALIVLWLVCRKVRGALAGGWDKRPLPPVAERSREADGDA